MSSRDEIVELLHELAAVMAEQRRRWYLFGAQAAILWGSPRYSTDADATAYIDFAELDEFIETMSRHGFECAFANRELVKQTRVIPFIHRPTSVPLDVVIGGIGLEEDFLHRAMSVDVRGTPIPVIRPDDLIITKILAGRPKDIEDVRGVIYHQRASIDPERIRSTLRLLEEALTQSDLLPVFEREWSEAD